MAITTPTTSQRTRYHHDAYQFLFSALRHTQRKLNRTSDPETGEEDDAHISGQELLEGVRDLALKQFGLMTRPVFEHWGIRTTADFGRMVFELVDRGEMRKTERDQFTDFLDVYDFEDAFGREYDIDTSQAFLP